ncbi:type VII secretion integral membrane protein EccD [Mycobacterium cookii]|uniref:type VII secretion integral membrane protein EccD n=1 Tax=Mycobacterium cookii TaxID=1775 RepID=UPI0013D1DB1C|nr:type VII secretion integral membrane protein EccD [Mycobacterium cookii]MCV7333019.1 type VII secretion integral membrane protein EccD [Mycobacterium cookii]
MTVHADSVRADLALPESVPLGSLLPAIVDIISGKRGFQAGRVAARYQMSLPGHIALDLSKTLSQIGIRDGALLILSTSSAELAAPRLDDVAEAVSESLTGSDRQWAPRASRLTAVLVAGWLAVVGAAIVVRGVSDAIRAETVAVSALTSLVGLAAGITAYRVFRENSAGLTLGLIGCGFAAIAGTSLIPGDVGAPNVLCAASACATSAAVMRVMSCHAAVFTALMGFGAVTATVALVGAVCSVPLRALGAGSAAISLILIEVSAPMSIMLAGLSSQLQSQPMLNSDRLKTRAIRARVYLNSMVGAFSASAALGAVGAALGPHPASGPLLAFTALIGGVLLSRARAHRDLAMSLPLITCGTLTLSGASIAAATAHPLQSVYIAAVSVGLAAAALCLGFVNLSTKISPVGQRVAELMEYLALAAVVPLACWICGFYAVARGFNLP